MANLVLNNRVTHSYHVATILIFFFYLVPKINKTDTQPFYEIKIEPDYHKGEIKNHLKGDKREYRTHDV